MNDPPDSSAAREEPSLRGEGTPPLNNDKNTFTLHIHNTKLYQSIFEGKPKKLPFVQTKILYDKFKKGTKN